MHELGNTAILVWWNTHTYTLQAELNGDEVLYMEQGIVMYATIERRRRLDRKHEGKGQNTSEGRSACLMSYL